MEDQPNIQADAAMGLYQSMLEATDAAILAGDYAEFARLIAVPHDCGYNDGKVTIDTHEKLRSVFDRTVHSLRIDNVARRRRHCIKARFVDDTRIEGTHLTWLVTSDLSIKDSYEASNTLGLVDGEWRVIETWFGGRQNALPQRVISHLEPLMSNIA